MFNFLKSIFTAEQTPLQLTETWGGTRIKDETEFGESVDGTATIRQMKNGKFRLLVNGNEVIGTYSRKRDALRGAARKGLSVTN